MKFRIEKRHCYLVTDSITKLEEVADNLIEVEFEFDAEWSGITKTARFSKGWEGEYVDKIITNGKCSVSLPYGEWYVGVMSTNLTTTPCKVEMGISEKSYNGYPAPAQSIYQQILDKLDSLSGADPDMVAEQIEAYFEEHPIDGLTDDDVNTLIAAYLEENPQGVDETAVNNLIASYLTANPQGLSESSVNSLIASYLTAHPQGVSESSVNTLIANYLTAHPQGLSESAVNGLIASYLTSNPQGLSETAVNNLIASYLTAHPQGVDESSVNNLIAAYITAHPEIGSGGGNKVAYAASATSDTIIKIVEEEGEEIELAEIDDTTVSSSSTWSSEKINKYSSLLVGEKTESGNVIGTKGRKINDVSINSIYLSKSGNLLKSYTQTKTASGIQSVVNGNTVTITGDNSSMYLTIVDIPFSLGFSADLYFGVEGYTTGIDFYQRKADRTINGTVLPNVVNQIKADTAYIRVVITEVRTYNDTIRLYVSDKQHSNMSLGDGETVSKTSLLALSDLSENALLLSDNTFGVTFESLIDSKDILTRLEAVESKVIDIPKIVSNEAFNQLKVDKMNDETIYSIMG